MEERQINNNNPKLRENQSLPPDVRHFMTIPINKGMSQNYSDQDQKKNRSYLQPSVTLPNVP